MKSLKFKFLTLSLLCLASVILSQPNEPVWTKSIPSEKIIEWRRHIHRNPELSYQEYRTSSYVDSILRSFGNIEVIRPAKTSVIGILKGRPGHTVAFRADMDALPVREETGLPFASSAEGISHACGHDGHTAMLLATAEILSRMQKDLKGTVYFIFQHAEESIPGGAQEIVKTGILNGVEAFFSIHIMTDSEAGHIGILPAGAASTAADVISLIIKGKGSHGSMPHLGVDPILTGAEMVMALQTVISRNVKPGEMAVISIGRFRSGEASNVIPDQAEIAGTVRTVSEATRTLVEDRVRSIIDNIAKANGASYQLDYLRGDPSVENDQTLREMAKASAKKINGPGLVFDAQRLTGSEDFAFYGQLAPELLMTLGGGKGAINHNPKFNFEESCMINGVKAEVQIILDFLNRK
jgi:amidohydrolase